MQEYAFSFELKTGSEIEDIVMPSYLSEGFRHRKTNYSDMSTHTHSLWHWYSYKSFFQDKLKENNFEDCEVFYWGLGVSKLLKKLKVRFLTHILFEAYINLKFDIIWFIHGRVLQICRNISDDYVYEILVFFRSTFSFCYISE